MDLSSWKPCPNCGKLHSASVLLCTKCGRYFSNGRLSRTDSPVGVVNCLSCGSPNYLNRDRCWKCLTPVTSNPVPVISAVRPNPPVPVHPASVQPAPISSAPDGILEGARVETHPSGTPPTERKPRKPKVDPALQQRLEEEVASLSEAIDNGRADADTFELRASYLVELNRIDEADADIQKAPEGIRKEILQGDIAAARGLFREACDIYEVVLATDPTRSGVARKLARLYVQQKTFHPDEVELVRDTLEKQIDRIAGSADWVGWISFLHERYAAAERWDEELSLLRAAVARSPLESNPRLGLWLVDALLATGAIQEAVEVLPELSLAAGHPAAVSAYRNTARRLIRIGQNGAARELYQLLAASPGAGDAANRLIMLQKASDGQRFVPLEKIGAGAVAEVWKAFDLYSGEYAGLKILHESLSGDAAAHEELRREFELMSSSLSPRIARAVPDTMEEDRFAMELLDYSLVALLEQPTNVAGLPLRQAVDIAQQIAEGIEYLHVRGLVYQDLSPQNILFKGPDVKLCDLGGVKEGEGTAADATVAKVAYASPEQCALLMGEASSTVDRRSDIYSLGVVLYQMVTGRIPFDGPDQAVLHAHLYSTPVAPLIHRPSAGRDLNTIILRCMARGAEDRFPTAAAVWAALDGVSLEA